MKIMNSSSYLGDFANNCYKIVSPFFLQESVNDFAICEHSSGTLLLVEDETLSQGVGRISNCKYEKGNCLSNSLKARPVTPKRNRFFLLNKPFCSQKQPPEVFCEKSCS